MSSQDFGHNVKKSVSSSDGWTIAFIFLWSIIIAVTAFFKQYLLHLSYLYVIKGLWEIYEQKCCLKFFCMHSFNDLTDTQYLWWCELISLKAISIYFLIFSTSGMKYDIKLLWLLTFRRYFIEACSFCAFNFLVLHQVLLP